MSYKRLTKWETSKGVKCIKYWQYSQEQIAERLALLEDKIESHKLVELKYRNGDYVFFISWLSGNVCEGTVVDWQEDSGYCIISGNDMISAYECFSTKAEAEKKLEELSKNR